MRLASVAVLAGVGGCELSLVPLPTDAEPELDVGVHVARDESTYFAVDAVLRRGTDAHGRLREVLQPLLYVDDTSVGPHAIDDQTTWGYSLWGVRATGATREDSLVVRVPMVAAQSALPTELTVTLPRAGERSDLEVLPGEDLRLTVAHLGAAPAGAELRHVSWNLVVHGDTLPGSPAAFITREGQGSYPTEFRIPRSSLDSLASSVLRALLDTRAVYAIPAIPYDASLEVESTLEWTIRLCPDVSERAPTSRHDVAAGEGRGCP